MKNIKTENVLSDFIFYMARNQAFDTLYRRIHVMTLCLYVKHRAYRLDTCSTLNTILSCRFSKTQVYIFLILVSLQNKLSDLHLTNRKMDLH